MRRRPSIAEPGYKDLDFSLTLRLLKFLRPHLRIVFAAFIGMSAATACSLAQPYIIKLAVDENLVKGTLTGFIVYVIAFALAILGGMGFTYIQMVLVSILGQRVIFDIRKALFKRVTSLPLGYYDKARSGALITRLTSDIEAINEMISSGLISVMGDIILITSISVILFIMEKTLFAYTLFSIFILVLFIRVMKRNLRESNRKIRVNTAGINAFLQEYISGIEVVKSFSRERKIKGRFHEKNDRFRADAVELSTLYSLYFPGVEFISVLAIATILFKGGAGVISGAISIGTVIAFIAYMEKFFGPVRDMSDKYNILQSALASCERVFSLMDMEGSPEYMVNNGSRETVVDGGHKSVRPGPAVEFRDVDFNYGGEEVLKGFTLSLDKGESLAIVGPTGAGKSTIANVLLRLYEPLKGSVSFMGRDVRSVDVVELRRKIVLVPQDPFMFNGSILENILAGEKHDEGRLARALEISGVGKLFGSSDGGLNARVGERGGWLSSGQRQLVSFARALYREPEIMLLDEATANIDPETEQLVISSLKKMMSEKTSIIIAHRLSTVSDCDRIAVLSRGVIVEEGSHAFLLESGGIYSKLYNLQINS